MDRTRMGLSEHSETQRGFIHFAVCFTPQLLIGGWAYPSEKWWSEFVSWDDDIPNIYIYIDRYIWKVIKFMFLKPPSRLKPMVPMFWTNDPNGPNESHANMAPWNCHRGSSPSCSHQMIVAAPCFLWAIWVSRSSLTVWLGLSSNIIHCASSKS